MLVLAQCVHVPSLGRSNPLPQQFCLGVQKAFKKQKAGGLKLAVEIAVADQSPESVSHPHNPACCLNNFHVA